MKPYRSPEFLKFAKQQGGRCCLCWGLRVEETPAMELHHYGEGGMGLKGSDYLIARVCRNCHASVQGKGRISFERLGRTNELEMMEADSLELLQGWTARLEESHVN